VRRDHRDGVAVGFERVGDAAYHGGDPVDLGQVGVADDRNTHGTDDGEPVSSGDYGCVTDS
jgi:hypothetical protein